MEKQHAALLELPVRLFYTALSHEKQDRIAEAVLCCGEALWRRREVVSDARDDTNSFHLFATSVGYMPQSGTTATRWGTSARCTG